jgi:hypothetical protein
MGEATEDECFILILGGLIIGMQYNQEFGINSAVALKTEENHGKTLIELAGCRT